MVLNSAAVGRRYPVSEPYEVGREHIRAFARAIGDASPLHHDPEAARAAGYPDVIAPPTYLAVLSCRDVEGNLVPDPVLGMDYSRVVHGRQRFVHNRPVHAGDVLTVSAYIESVVVRGPVSQVTLCCEVFAEGGEHISSVYCTMVERGADDDGSGF